MLPSSRAKSRRKVVVNKSGNGIKKSSVYAGLRAWFHVLEGLGTWGFCYHKSFSFQSCCPSTPPYPPLPFFILFMLSFYNSKPYRLCIFNFLCGRQSNVFRISLVYIHTRYLPLPFHLFYVSSFLLKPYRMRLFGTLKE